MPSYRQCIGFGRLIGWEPQDDLQRICLDHIASNPYTVFQCLRQYFKTEGHSIHGATGIPLGEPCGIGMPTLNQGGRVMAARIEKKLEKFEKLPGVTGKRLIDNALYKMWNWSDDSVLGVQTMHETGDDQTTGKSVQGWTFQNLKIDEAHECGLEVYKKLLPTTDRFRREGKANIGLIGVGGYGHSLIETMKRDDDRFKAIRIIPDLDNDIVPAGAGFAELPNETVYNIFHYRPDLRDFYQEERDNSLGNQWSQHYMCETQHGGSGLIFQQLPESTPMFWNMNPRKTAAIDVGAGEDPTVLSFFWNDGTHRDLFESHTLVEHDIEKTVAWVIDHLKRHSDRLDPADVRFEKNGPGKQFGIYMKGYWPWRMAVGVHTSDQGPKGKQGKKTRWIERAQLAAAKGKFSVSDKAARARLSMLSYEIDDAGNYTWPHDDYLSTVWLDFSGAGSASGV